MALPVYDVGAASARDLTMYGNDSAVDLHSSCFGVPTSIAP